MDIAFQEKIRQRAYAIWMAAGMIDGDADSHWLHAEEIVRHEAEAPITSEPLTVKAVEDKAVRPAAETTKATSTKTKAKTTKAKTTKAKATKAKVMAAPKAAKPTAGRRVKAAVSCDAGASV